MNLGFSKEEKLLVDSARDFMEKEAAGLAREGDKSGQDFSRAIWAKMAELGWMGILFPEEFGGVQGNFLELIYVIEEMGRYLLPSPFIPTMISGYALLLYGSEAQKRDILPKLTEGKFILIPAFFEAHPGKGRIEVQDRVMADDGDHVIDGTRLFVPHAGSADGLLFNGESENGRPLFLVDAKAPGVYCNLLETMGPEREYEVILKGVVVPSSRVLGGGGEDIADDIILWGALCESAYILGMLEKVMEMAVKHAKSRIQFGRPIGSFQAIQHQCAEMATDIEKLKFLTYQGAWRLTENLPVRKEISMAKAKAGDASRRVTLLSIKVHGGVGITEEYDLQLYFRKAKASETAYGDGDFHRERIANQMGL